MCLSQNTQIQNTTKTSHVNWEHAYSRYKYGKLALLYSGGDVTTDYLYNGKSAHLLHVSQHILPAVKHPPAFFRVQLIDEVCCVVLIAVLIPDRHTVKVLAEAHSRCELTLTLAGRHQWEPDRKMSALSKLSASPQHLFTIQGASNTEGWKCMFTLQLITKRCWLEI